MKEFASSYLPYLLGLIRIPAIIVAAFIATRAMKGLIKKGKKAIIEKIKKTEVSLPEVEVDKRADTVSSVLRKVVAVVIWIVAGLMVLDELGFDPKPFLAGAGIVGLAVGFGAQNLVRDVICGFFMILENQIRVGDVAILNGTGGLVEAIHLRTTVLRGLDGTVHVFPNGTINSLSNMTREYSYYVLDIGVAYKEDVDRVMSILKEIGDELLKEEGFKDLIIEPLEILGVDQFGDSAIIIKARIKTLPIKQWAVGREMNRRIKIRFDAEKVEIPFPHRTFYFGEASIPVLLKMEQDREELKRLIREVMEEAKTG